MDLNKYIEIKKEVRDALKNNAPVVALESSVIAQGMPYPHNEETALREEEVVMKSGAVPATIAVIDGVIKVGLSRDEIKKLARPSTLTCKIGKKDIPAAVSKRLTGGTTVSGTLAVMDMVGIKVLATGGIGGVHQHFSETLDVSEDLEVMQKTSAVIVSAGAKAILDIPKTLEYLETKGVLILGFQTSVFPLFYSSSSPYKLEWSVASAGEVADIVQMKAATNLPGAVLVANPIAADQEIKADALKAIIAKAVEEASLRHISGKELTPYLLDKIAVLTKGKSLAANIALILHNCAVAAQIARALKPRQPA